MRASARAYLPGAVLTLLAVLLLSFTAQVTVVSQLRHERAQRTAYATLRLDLASATAPIGQLDAAGRPYPPGTAVAVLRIPALDLREVVFEGTDSQVLEAGPGHRRDTVLPGQAGTSVLLGRRSAYGAPFRDLDLLNSGDTITVATGQGEHTYTVLGVRRAGDLEPPALAAGAGRLTLVTAAGQPFFPQDLIQVDADLTSPAQPAPPRPIRAGQLPAAEKPLQGDPGAWTLVVLWGEAVLLAALALSWARTRWGTRPAWVVGVPVLGALGLTTVDQLVRLLPNLL